MAHGSLAFLLFPLLQKSARKKQRLCIELEQLETRTVPTVVIGQTLTGLTALSASYNGTNTVSSPPNTMAAESNNEIVEVANSALEIASRTGSGSPTTIDFSTLFKSLPSGDAFTDPRVIFDDIANVFVITDLENDSAGTTTETSTLWYAISKNENPASKSDFTINSFAFTEKPAGNNTQAYSADFDNLGYNANVYSVTVDMYTDATSTSSAIFNHPSIVEIQKGTVSNPTPTPIQIDFPSSFPVEPMTPSRMHGALTGGPMFFVGTEDGAKIQVVREDGIISNGVLNTSPSFELATDHVPSYSPVTYSTTSLTSGFYTVQQEGGTMLAVPDERFAAPADTMALPLMNQTPSWELVAADTVEVSGVIQARWYQITLTGAAGLAPSIGLNQVGEATPAVSGSSTFNPAIDITGKNVIMLGYSEAGPNEYLSSYVVDTADQQPQTTAAPLNIFLDAGKLIQAGTETYLDNNINRTGDNDSLAADPVGPTSVLVANEYSNNLFSPDNWSTVVAPATGIANNEIVEQMYLDLLNRQADSGGMKFYTNELVNGVSTLNIAQAFTGGIEFRNDVVKQAYETYLGRAPDSSGGQFWAGQIINGNFEALKIGLIGSAEFYGKAGNTNSGFVQNLFLDVLFRQPSSSDYTYWEGQLGSGSPPSSTALTNVATGIITSSEYYDRLLDRSPATPLLAGYYQEFLRRSTSLLEYGPLVNLLMNGQMTDTGVIQTLVGSLGYEQYVANNPPPLP